MRGTSWLGRRDEGGTRGARVASTLAALVAMLAAQPHAWAHSVSVDGATSEWMSRAPATTNLGILARDASERGSLVWLDARTDTRTDLFAPESGADLTTFAVTADTSNLYFRVALGGDAAPVASPVQLQIAIDVDRTAGSGNTAFAGFADTDVAPEAAWERLIQTNGGLGGAVRVRDTAYAVVGVGTMATNTTTNETEIAIPWTLLPAGTRDVLRFTVAVFRENPMGDTLDIMGSSDALDVISDYGDPSSTVTNTWVEVMDGVVNHSLDVWLDRTSREPYAPIVVTRFMADAPAPGSEWAEIRNQTPVTLDLSSFAIGDEETLDAGEFMGSFPPGSTLASGGVAVIAASVADFMTSYGVAADYQSRAGAGASIDLVRMITWGAATSWSMANTGDEIIVLGWNRTMVDVVTFQLGVYPGITGRSVPGSNRVAVRDPVTRDTDNCTTDFPTTLDDCGPGAGTCATCRACRRFVCVVDTGAACDDGDMCTSGTTCTAAAACTGGSAVSCDDSNPCTTDSCATSTGCRNTVSPGALCSDGDACTTGDVCSMTGVCTGTAMGCDDMNPCTDDSCSAGGCVHTPAAGRACSDGSMCTTGDACNAMGACVGTTLTCPEDTNPCTTATCAPASGCGFANNTAACDDGNACTTADVCAAGACSGTPITCNDMNGCTTDACMGGTCRFTPTTGAACNDGNACTSSDACDGAGTCVGTPVCDSGGPIPDAAVEMPDAFVVGDDAFVVPADDAGAMTGEDAFVVGEDAGAATEIDAAIPAGTDAGMAASDAGRRDGGGAGLDAAGSGLPPSSGGCACRVEGGSERGASSSLLALVGLALALGRRRARGVRRG